MKSEDYINYQERLSMSGCMSCSARQPDRTCIPKGFFCQGNTEGPTVLFVLSRAQEVDEQSGRLFSSQEKETFKRWIAGATNGKFPSFYVTAALRCRTEDDRNPKIGEIKTCSYIHLWKEINFLQPNIIISLGEKALIGINPMQSMAQAKDNMLKRIQSKITVPEKGYAWEGPVYSIYHPAFIQMGQGKQYEDICIDLMRRAFEENRS